MAMIAAVLALLLAPSQVVISPAVDLLLARRPLPIDLVARLDVLADAGDLSAAEALGEFLQLGALGIRAIPGDSCHMYWQCWPLSLS